MLRMDYDAYLQSDGWKDKRREALHRASNRCQVCNSQTSLDVHHRTYERLGFEHNEDLTVLCRECHELFHAGGRMPVYVPPPPPVKRDPKAMAINNARVFFKQKAMREMRQQSEEWAEYDAIQRERFLKETPTVPGEINRLIAEHSITRLQAFEMHREQQWQAHCQHRQEIDAKREVQFRKVLEDAGITL